MSQVAAGRRHLALVGPTASGKTEVAVAVALALGDVEILTGDSMQVYRGVAHHLVDLADPSEEWTLTRWLDAATDALAGIEARGHRALLVGGTGLYVQALVDGFTPPGRWPAVVADLSADPDTAGLYRRLADLDPVGAGRIEPGNRRRILRALEVSIGSGRPFSAHGPGVDRYPPSPWRLAALWLPRPLGAERIERRVAAMVEAGLVQEVRRLAASPAGLSRTARQALGYREVLRHVEDGAPLGPALDETVRRTRALARRQRVWWRRDPRLAWFGADGNPLAVTAALLGEWGAR